MSTLSEPRRPRLLPQNRKLRHLKGLSLRRLSFAPSTWQTADDAVIPRSPSKLGKVRENGQLHASRSSDSLRFESLRRPKPASRSSSLSLAHASPLTRQKKLMSLVDNSVADVFFSLHVPGCDEPVYISEMRKRSANFDFRFFHLTHLASYISRSCIIIIRVWSKRPKQSSWVFLLEELIDLRRLNFIGTLTDRQFPPNALIFHLEDGMYSLDFPASMAGPKPAPPAATSSYNTLMKLANLENSIQDAIDTRVKITQQINEILEASPGDPTFAAKEKTSLAEKYVASQRRVNKLTEKRRDDLQVSIQSRREAIAKGKEAQTLAEEDIANHREKLAASADLVRSTEQQIHGQRRRICSELSDMFPIDPIPNAPPLSFQICSLPLTNSVYDAATAKVINEDMLSAALGLAAMLTLHLQFYLSHPLPYPLYVHGSRSYARDDISQIPDKDSQRREFPLYLPRGGSTIGQWRFEYGWFLLNKNIEALCAAEGLKVVDIRHSLPNLKYLLYVCSAGTEEMPERKKGGVRGLWAGRLKSRMTGLPSSLADGESSSSATGSRRGSIDSDVMNQHGETLKKAALHGNGQTSGSWSMNGKNGLPFAENVKYTLRTKGLRENVAK